MAFAYRIVPGSLKTCEDIEIDLFEFKSNCSVAKEAFFANGFIDIPSFCGCSGAPIPNLCPLCNTSVANTRSSLNVGNSSYPFNCSELEVIAKYITNQDYCLEVSSWSTACCTVSSNDTCSICPVGSRVQQSPDLQVPSFGGATCASLDFNLSSLPLDGCHAIQAEVSTVLDVAAWCGCQGVQPPDFCPFCQNASKPMPNPEYIIPASGGLTCRDASNLARFIVDPTICFQEIGLVARGCCRKDDRCTVCPSGGFMGNPNRPFVFGAGDTNCSELDFEMGFLSNKDCAAFHKHVPINIASWCGCDGVRAPGLCQLCPEGYVVTNGDKVASNSHGLTCGVLADMAGYVVDPNFCKSIVASAANECCKKASTPPTPAIVLPVDQVQKASSSSWQMRVVTVWIQIVGIGTILVA